MEQSGRRAAARPATETRPSGVGADAGERGGPRRSLRRLGASQRAIPLLVVVALVSAFGLAAITFVGARANAIAAAQTRALQDTQVVRQLIADQGPSLTSHDGTLVAGVDNQGYTLNGDNTLVDRSRSLVGGYATIYALQGSALTAVASNMPAGTGNATGDALTGAPFDALLGNCGAVDTQNCHQTYAGLMTLHGREYVAGFRPLFDASGGFVGALAVALPSSDVLGPVNQLAVLLLLVGLLLCFLSVVVGSWLLGSRSDRFLTTLDGRLDAVAASAIELERLARAQVERANQQGRAARQVSEQARSFDALASALERDQVALRDSAGNIWQEVSQPGIAPDAQTALQWARQAAVVAARVGTATERSREACRQLVVMMNHVVAESDVSRDGGHDLQERAQALRKAVEGVERTVGDRLINRPHGLDALPLLYRSRRADVRSATGETSAAPAARRPQAGTVPARPATDTPGGHGRGLAVSERLWADRERRQSAPSPTRPRPAADGQRRPDYHPGNTGHTPRTRAEGPLTGKQSHPPTRSSWTGQRRSMPPTPPSDHRVGPGRSDGRNVANWSGEFSARPPRAPLSDPSASRGGHDRPRPASDLGLPSFPGDSSGRGRTTPREPHRPDRQ